MKQLVLFAASCIALANSMAPARAQSIDLYEIDPSHTEVFFGWSHAGVSRQHGEFTRVQGTLYLNPDDPTQSAIEVAIDATSLSSGYVPLDKKLKSAAYLDVATYPVIQFQSTSVEQISDDHATVTGNLTLHGITREVVLDTHLTHHGAHPVGQYIGAYKGSWVAFHATTMINHMAFGVGNYSTGPIAIEINTELKKQ